MTVTDINSAVESGSLSTEKSTYRAYVKLNDKGEVAEIVAKSESGARAKDAAGKELGLAANWHKLEAAGYQQLNENEVIRYSVKDMAGFTTLIPDVDQQMYVIQSGINYIQNAKANALSLELQEGTGDKGVAPAPAYNNETIDLREALNAPPQKKSLTPIEKMLRALSGLGLDDDATNALLLEVAKRKAAMNQAASAAAQITSGEEVTA